MLVWLDVETTGLEPERDALLEVGMIATEDDLTEVGRTSVLLMPDPFVKVDMVAEVKAMHEDNGLWDEARAYGHSRLQAEEMLRNWVRQVGGKEAPLAGNTVHFDRAWIKAKMPFLERMFHYRNLDVSSLKIFNKMANFAEPWEGDRKIHRALPDLEDSIAELEHYWTAIDDALEDAATGIDISEIGGTLP